MEAIVSVGDFDLDSEGFTGATFGLAVWVRVEGFFLTVVAVLFVGTNLGFWVLLRDVVEATFLTGGGMAVVGGFWGKRVEAEFDLVCPGAGAAYFESILETFVWEGCLRNVPAVGFVDCCLLRSRADICLVTVAREFDMVLGGIARSLVEGQRAGGSTCGFSLRRRVAVTCLCFPRLLIPGDSLDLGMEARDRP